MQLTIDRFCSPLASRRLDSRHVTTPLSCRRDAFLSLGPVKVNQSERLFTALLIAGELGATYNELSELTGVRINAVCGRMNELRRVVLANGDMLIEVAGVRVGVSGKNNVAWRVNPSYHEPSRGGV